MYNGKFSSLESIKTAIEIMHWYAIYTKPRHEKKVHDQLLGKGIISFLPMVEQVRQWKDRKKRVNMPLFNSYVFVQIDLKNRYATLQTHGVVRLVSFGGEPTAIPNWQIEQLQQVIEKPASLKLEAYLREGDLVEVVQGPFKGIRGRLREIRGEARIVINIDGIFQSASFVIDKDFVQKIEV